MKNNSLSTVVPFDSVSLASRNSSSTSTIRVVNPSPKYEGATSKTSSAASSYATAHSSPLGSPVAKGNGEAKIGELAAGIAAHFIALNTTSSSPAKSASNTEGKFADGKTLQPGDSAQLKVDDGKFGRAVRASVAELRQYYLNAPDGTPPVSGREFLQDVQRRVDGVAPAGFAYNVSSEGSNRTVKGEERGGEELPGTW